MCCFSQPVKHVSNTRIFARLTGRGTQYLAYSMRYAAAGDLAMLLPLPVRQPAADSAVNFLDLKGYPSFFADLERGFPEPQSRSGSMKGAFGGAGGGAMPQPLAVHSVGDFEASFVPSLSDFGRLDARFTLPRATWDRVPAYQDYGFAVFKLKAGKDPRGVHPMAFEFPTRNPDALYLPTVHIHDGRVRPTGRFDHQLYFQDRRLRAADYWDSEGRLRPATAHEQIVPSYGVAERFVDASQARGIVDPTQHCFKRTLRGYLPNQDTWIKVE